MKLSILLSKRRSVPFIILMIILSFGNTKCFGRTIYTMASGDWDQTAIWSTTGVSGPTCSCIPIVGDTVIIDGFEIDFDDGSTDITISELSITNASGGKTSLEISDSRTLTVTNNVTVTMATNINKDVILKLKSNLNPKLLIGGDITFTRVVGNTKKKKLILDITDNAEVIVEGNYTYNYLNSDDNKSDAIKLNKDAIFIIGPSIKLSLIAPEAVPPSEL